MSDSHLTIRNDLLKFVYASMLLNFPFEEILDFWKTLPLVVDGAEYKDFNLLDYIVEENKRVPAGYFYKVMNSFELWLRRKKLDPGVFFEKNLHAIGRGFFIDARRSLVVFAPYASELYSTDDPRHSILRAVPRETSRLLSIVEIKNIKHSTNDEMNSWYLQVDWENEKEIIYNDEIFTVAILRMVPLRFGIESFNSVDLIVDRRNPSEIISEEIIKENGRLIINGKSCGETGHFHAFCKQLHGIDFHRSRMPDPEVFYMKKDFVSSNGRILKKGSIYNGPAGIVRIQYSGRIPRSDMLSSLISDLKNDGGELWNKAWQMHAAQKKIHSTVKLFYSSKTEKLLLDKKVIARSLHARILHYLLTNNLKTGRTEFELQEFLHGSTLFEISGSANITLRLQRVMELVKRKLKCVEMSKTGRGSFVFKPGPVIILEERE